MFKEYFTYSKRERNAIIILLLIIIASIIIPFFYQPKFNTNKINIALADSINALQKTSTTAKKYSKNWSNQQSDFNDEKVTEIILFYFDPNTLDMDGWKKLGLRDKTINTILNYISKGGKFRTPEDIRKIWGLKKEEADRLIPYIRIKPDETYKTSANRTKQVINTNKNEKKSLLDINTVTAWQLKQIPNIGNSLPYKIVTYREKLGGYLFIHQLKEVYEMTDTLYHNILPYIQLIPIKIKKINLNKATEYDLSMHPYIDKNIAKAIVIQRTKYGTYNSIQELKTKIVFLKEEVFLKFEPYITVQDE